MKFNYSVILIVLASLLSCQSSTSNYHNGNYVFIDSTYNPVLEESIFINGSRATLRIRSLFNKSKLEKSKHLCFQHPGKIDLPMGRRQPITIPVDKDGNLVWDNKIFKKQPIHIILTTPVPEAFQESEKIK